MNDSSERPAFRLNVSTWVRDVSHGFIPDGPWRLPGWLIALGLWLVLATSGLGGGQTQAQGYARYFPETGHYASGFFLFFWETHGNIEVFGLPITEAYVSPTTGRTTQYFERARFELTELDGRPYVALGRLGAEWSEGRSFRTTPPVADCPHWHYFPQTQHIVQYGFKEIWETRGGERIFGLPLSEEIGEMLPDGTHRTVQYFERARFEYRPEYPPGQRVFLANLGRRMAPPELQAPLPPTAAPGTLPPGWQAPLLVSWEPVAPAVQPVAASLAPAAGTGTETATDTVLGQVIHLHHRLPSSEHAFVMPLAAPSGSSFTLMAGGYHPDEAVAAWVTTPQGEHRSLDSAAIQMDRSGIVQVRVDSEGLADGVYTVVAEGMTSKQVSSAAFEVTGAFRAGPGTPRPPNVNGQATPTEGGIGTVFQVRGQGLLPNEAAEFWMTNPAGAYTLLPDPSHADGQGRIGYEPVLDIVAGPDLGPGVYGFHFRGTTSGRRVDVYVTLVH
ncbi:MAG: hypothetical protein HC884_03260 [Chloroflexaceae bacterium]|nr:hypothetical protein [Chloroflexaceae bacterium]